jgi:hypothetical protein
MPQGHSIATCAECGRPYITGDCIMLGGKCDECESGKKLSTLMNVNLEEEMKVLSDAVKSIKKKQKKTLKNDISLILHGALSGETKEYRTDDGFVRWGLVEQDMFKAIDKCFAKELGDD